MPKKGKIFLGRGNAGSELLTEERKKDMKKIFLMGLSLVLVAVLAIGGTFAYLTDTDETVNVMTLGNVDIEHHEYQRVVNADGSYKTDNVDGQNSYVLEEVERVVAPLLPIVGDPSSPVGYPYAGYDSTPVRMSQVGSYGGMDVFAGKNAVDKFVTVENKGKTDAYVRTIVAIEVGSATDDLIGTSYHGTWTKTDIGTVAIDGINYSVTEYVYAGGQLSDGTWRHKGGVLPAGDTSYPNLSQVYIGSEANNADMTALDGNGNGTLDILVVSQAVQADGFDTAEAALEAAFPKGVDNANVAGWFGDAEIPVTVESQEALKEAVAAGEKNIVVTGAELDEKISLGSDVDATFVDCTISGNNAWGYVNNATFQGCTFDSGSDVAAMHFDQLYGELVVNDCTFTSGKVQIGTDGSSSAVFNNCVFGETTSTSIWAEKGMRFYCPTEFNNCEFNNRVVLAGSNGLELTFNNCTMNGGTPVYYVDNTDGIIRGGNVPTVVINN